MAAKKNYHDECKHLERGFGCGQKHLFGKAESGTGFIGTL